MPDEIVNTNTEVTTTAQQTNQTSNQTTATSTSTSTKSENKQENDWEAVIQRAVDRATNKLGNENKKLRNELDALKKVNLSEAELNKLELQEKEQEIAKREQKLLERENRLFTIKAIKDAGLDDGSSNALDLVDFVMADTEEATLARVKAFESLVKKFVAAEVNRTFKENGRNPEKSGTTSGSTQTNIAATIGKRTADRAEAANKVLDYYLGGK